MNYTSNLQLLHRYTQNGDAVEIEYDYNSVEEQNNYAKSFTHPLTGSAVLEPKDGTRYELMVLQENDGGLLGFCFKNLLMAGLVFVDKSGGVPVSEEAELLPLVRQLIQRQINEKHVSISNMCTREFMAHCITRYLIDAYDAPSKPTLQ